MKAPSSSDLCSLQNKLDLISTDDVNSKVAALLNHLIAVSGFFRSIPSLLEGRRGSADARTSTNTFASVAAKVLAWAMGDEPCRELMDSLATVTENVTELQELFAAGAGVALLTLGVFLRLFSSEN